MEENITWKKYPDNKPIEAGYYMTLYYNVKMDKKLYKALSYNPTKDEWFWRDPAEVIAYVPASRNDHYVPCMMWCEENKIEGYKE